MRSVNDGYHVQYDKLSKTSLNHVIISSWLIGFHTSSLQLLAVKTQRFSALIRMVVVAHLFQILIKIKKKPLFSLFFLAKERKQNTKNGQMSISLNSNFEFRFENIYDLFYCCCLFQPLTAKVKRKELQNIQSL